MTTLELTPQLRSALRAQAHPLKPVVLIGEQGLNPANMAEIDLALKSHGLIKVRVFGDNAEARAIILQTICETLGAASVQTIGKLLVIYRPQPKTPKEQRDEEAPDAKRGRSPRTVKLVVPSSSPTHRAKVKRITLLGNQRLTATGKIKRAKPRLSSAKKSSRG
ncbi:MAG: YhbY family RNA-binding protein [Burkholderiaceae bacterium]|nr:YhbY family RNA-binding protein [Burkholderiaceae bacterium]